MALLDEAEYRRWRANGEAALAGARAQRDAGVHQWACFNCEQAAQLALKALLHGIGAGPWGHDLLDLASKTVNAGIEVPTDIDEAFRRLYRYYIQTRSPDAYASGDVGTRYRGTESDRAINDADSVLAWADRTWGSEVSQPVIERRRIEQQRLIDTARSYVSHLASRLQIDRAWVAGSVARGDFNLWSDVDVVIVAPRLPERGLDRLDLFSDAPARVQVIAYTPVEFERALQRNDPLAKEAKSVGIDILAT